jgi:hypothetical protein
MADRRIVCIRTQKPGQSDYVVMYPAGDKVGTIRGDMAQIKDGIQVNLASIYPGDVLEFEFEDIPFDQLFP